MLSPRSWTCTYTSDTHKKPKNARWVDGILEVSFFGATERFAKLYAADDDNKPVGAPVARRKLGDAEFDAVLEGDPLRGLEGFDVHPDDEIGRSIGVNRRDEAGGAAGEEARRSRLKNKTRGTGELKPIPFASAAALRPFRAPAATSRGPATTATGDARTSDKTRTSRHPAPRFDRDHGRAGSGSESDESDASDPRAVLARFAGDGSGAFADLYAAAGVGTGARASQGPAGLFSNETETARSSRTNVGPPANRLGVPLAERRSAYAAFDEKEAAAANAADLEPDSDTVAREKEKEKAKEKETNAFSVSRGDGPGGVSDLAAALARAGPAGVAGLASLAASFGTPSSVDEEGVAALGHGVAGGEAPARGPPTKRRAPPKATFGARDPARDRGPSRGALARGNAFETPRKKVADARVTRGTALLLAFPSSGSVEAKVRASAASDARVSFADAEAYRAHFCGALRAEMAETLRRARLDLDRVAGGSSFARGGADREEAARVSRAFKSSSVSGAAYHADCAVRFETVANGPSRPSRPDGRRRKGGGGGGEGDDDDGDGDVTGTGRADAAAEITSPIAKTFLYLNDPDERRGGVSRGVPAGPGPGPGRAGAPRYCKGDLWVLSNTARFEVASPTRVGDKTKAPFAAVARALWHGPDKDGKLEIQLLCARPGALAGDRRAHRVYAMRARDASRALAEHDAFASVTDVSFPLLPHVSGGPIVRDAPVAARDDDEQETLERAGFARCSARAMRETRGLNRDQALATAAALRAVLESARRVPLRDRAASPVRLVHGPFGSGKTRALASFVIEAVSLLEAEGHARRDFRILLAAHTNVAVDRLLKALLDQGFDDFVRVGALRKMDPAVLSRSLHVAAASSRARGGGDENEPVLGRGGLPLRGKAADHARELRAMLRDAKTPSSRAALARELRETREGKAEARARALGKCRVVATTAASCANECLRDSTFQLVVLDEASQITEPAFVAAVAPFGCETLVAVGDPKQLGPVVENDNKASTARSRSLFARLEAAGHAPTTLKTQYRCHPALSAVANACFYGGVLVDGVDARDRAPLLRVARAVTHAGEPTAAEISAAEISPLDGALPSTAMPPLVWVDVAMATGPSRDIAHDRNRSAFSTREAKIAALIVDRLRALGIDSNDVGVVTLFRAHAEAVAAAAAALEVGAGSGPPHDEASRDEAPRVSAVQVSTVDAFQGQEKEVMVLSLCGGGGGPFATEARLNVALTRAKRHLIVLGDSKDPAASEQEAWRLCLRTARRAPCGFVDASSVRSEAATRAWLAAWRRNGDDRSTAAAPPERRDAAEETRDDGDDGDSDGDGDGDGDASLDASASDPFDPIVLSGDDDTLFVPARSPLSRSPLAARLREKEKAEARAETRAPGSASAPRRKPLLKIEPAPVSPVSVKQPISPVSPNRKRKRPTTRESANEKASAMQQTFADEPDEPDPELDTLPPARLAFHDALRGAAFGPEQYWRAYCDLHRAALYGDKQARARVECSRLGAVLATHFRLRLGAGDPRAWDRGETRRLVTSAVLPGMGTFVHAAHGFRWTRLRNLIAAFDDEEALAKDPAGFGAHVLEDARTQEEDEAGARAFADGGGVA